MEMTMAGLRLGIGAIALVAGLHAASAAEPVAIVETLAAEGTGLQFMDYVEEGQVIELGPAGTITLGYLASCHQEQIRGGRVEYRIGGDASFSDNITLISGDKMLSADGASFDREVIYKRTDGRAVFTWNIMPVPVGLVPR